MRSPTREHIRLGPRTNGLRQIELKVHIANQFVTQREIFPVSQPKIPTTMNQVDHIPWVAAFAEVSIPRVPTSKTFFRARVNTSVTRNQ
jgi:hypothetical protein